MKIKAILPYFGGKRKLAGRIVEALGDHKSYWEPFCGSMAVLFAKQPCEMETVNDLHGDLINMAKVVRDEELGFKLYERLCKTLYCENLFREAKEKWTETKVNGEIDIDRAYWFFVTSWMGLNGVSGTERCNYQFALRWSRGGGQGATRWQSVVSSMPAWHKRLRSVVIINRDGFGVLDNIKDGEDTAIYCDPPYFEKSDKYVHDFEGEDHERLADSLKRFSKARVVVSYYDCPQVRAMYDGFEFIELSKSYASLRNATRGPKKKPRKEQTEILICNQRKKGLFG
jgi:DNA adenine methylase